MTRGMLHTFANMKFRIAFIFGLCFAVSGFAQDSLKLLAPSLEFNKHRFWAVAGTEVAGYGGSLVFLSSAWYKDYQHASFHTFNDGAEWLQMDKAGHLTTCWYLGKIGIDMMEWSGVSKRKAIWYGAAGSFLYLGGIEVLDGFSS